ncbi:MraY family glycosyltransferase [Pseudorhodobacter ferrugineus]|uniref:MraY family glycosyltransferase n=1 Tax=Pseudorhodobacter ferrugineus TaxID=77008 RepID=UPI000AE1C622|nr:glycosyltransferase [Pseudorhodobacter ferrugineus]
MSNIVTTLGGYAFVLIISFSISLFLMRRDVSRWMQRKRGCDLRTVQSAHLVQTSRLGGISVVIATSLGLWMFPPEGYEGVLPIFLIALLPVFIAGAKEDIFGNVSPRWRLLAAVFSSVLTIVFFGVYLTKIDLYGLDWALGFSIFGFAFTVLLASGICHAFNIIDGVNGLCGVTSILTLGGLLSVGHATGDSAITGHVALIIPAILGFVILNWPFGKIFLGDAGAYTIGHTCAWIGIFLLERNADVAGTAVALLFFWPIADTFFSIYRRKRAGRPIGQPDRLHFHQLVMRGLEIMFLGRNRRKLSNPLTIIVLSPCIAAPILAGVLFWDKPFEAGAALLAFSILFVFSYFLGVKAVHNWPLSVQMRG